jgi:DNA-binding transcriptional LysR family regulator
MFEDVRALQGLARELHNLEAGRLELIAIGAIGTHVLVPVLATLAREMPEVSMTLSATVERDVTDWLVASQADWGFCMVPVDRSDVLCEPLLRFAACCALPAGHRLARKSVLVPGDFEGERFISFRRDGYMRTIVDRVFVEHAVHRRLNLEVYASEQACAMVARGMGVSIVEPFSLQKYVARGEVVSRPFEPTIPYTLYLLRNRRRPPSQVGQRFLASLHATLPRILRSFGVRKLPL